MAQPTPDSGTARETGGESRDTTPGDTNPNQGWGWVFLALGLVVAVIGGGAFIVGKFADRSEQALEDKAAAVIEARYNDDDMNATLISPVKVTTTDEGVLIATWDQLNRGESWPMECTTPLTVSEDERFFGFEPIPERTPREVREAQGIMSKCTSYRGLSIGLEMPPEEESSPEEGDN